MDILLHRDNYRAFFEHVFPLLLRRIFGYDGPSWLSTIAAGEREADAYALTSLLSPNGGLACDHEVDNCSGTRLICCDHQQSWVRSVQRRNSVLPRRDLISAYRSTRTRDSELKQAGGDIQPVTAPQASCSPRCTAWTLTV